MITELVSIVMPAYNTEKYIAKAIDSVINQTYTNWEIVIVDDCSVDNTYNIASKYLDARIKVHKRTSNSGAAYLPRIEALKMAQGEWILELDSDDYIEKNCLELLLNDAESKKVDICSPQMIGVYEDGKPTGFTVPRDDFEFGKVYWKNAAFLLAVPSWKIGMNGALIKKSLWLKCLDIYQKEGKREVHDDENLSRIMLYEANGVTASKAKYYWQSNSSSVSNLATLDIVGWNKSNNDLLGIAENYFGKKSFEYSKVIEMDYATYHHMYSQFKTKVALMNYDAFYKGIEQIKIWHDRIYWNVVLKEIPGIHTMLFSNFKLSILYMSIRYPNKKFIFYGIDKLNKAILGK